jgi:hypothetical protein
MFVKVLDAPLFGLKHSHCITAKKKKKDITFFSTYL